MEPLSFLTIETLHSWHLDSVVQWYDSHSDIVASWYSWRHPHLCHTWLLPSHFLLHPRPCQESSGLRGRLVKTSAWKTWKYQPGKPGKPGKAGNISLENLKHLTQTLTIGATIIDWLIDWLKANIFENYFLVCVHVVVFPAEFAFFLWEEVLPYLWYNYWVSPFLRIISWRAYTLLCFQLSLLSPKHNLRGNRSSNLSAEPDKREQTRGTLHEVKISLNLLHLL